MKTKFYGDLYVIDDSKKIDKLMNLFNLSVKNDLSKWTQTTGIRSYTSGQKYDLITYRSPKYNDDFFIVELATDPLNNGRLYYGVAFIKEKNPGVLGCEMQMFSEWIYYNDPVKKIRASLDSLRDNVFEEGILKLENALAGKNDRKDKLIALNIETYKTILEESFIDFKNEPTLTLARMIARTAYGFNLNHHLPYSEWIEKFKDYSIVLDEIKSLDNYES